MNGATVTLPIKVLLCGAGWWGMNWLENIRANKDYQLVGVVVRNLDRAADSLTNRGVQRSILFDDIEKAIQSTKPDAVVVVVSPDRHGEIVRPALAMGVHVLSEKPLAKDLSEAREFLELHNKHKHLQFIVSQNYRGREQTAQLRRMLASKAIGEIGFFIYSHQQTVKIPGYRLKMGSPILEDMAIHHFDLIRYLTKQEFVEVFARERTVNWSWFSGNPVLMVDLTMTNNVSGIYCGSWASEGKIGSWNGNIQVFGSGGCLELNDEGNIFLYDKHEVDETLLGKYHPGKIVDLEKLEFTELQYSLENFKNALLTNSKAETDIEDNIKSYAAVLAARESISGRTIVSIDSIGL